MLQLDFNLEYNIFSFENDFEPEKLYIKSDSVFLKSLSTTLHSNKYCVILAKTDSKYEFKKEKHFHIGADFIFINFSLKNKFKSLSIKSDFNNFVNFKTYLKEIL